MSILDQVDTIVRSLASNPYIGLAGFVIAVISLAFAYYVSQRDRRVRLLNYFMVSSNLIEDGMTLFPRLDVTFDGRKLSNFTITRLTIKNMGTEVIKTQDVATGDPIRISVAPQSDIELLECAIVDQSDKENNFSLARVDDHNFEVRFDFIESGDSATIQVLHTGKDSQPIVVSGKVIGATRPFDKRNTFDSPKLNKALVRITRGLFHTSVRRIMFLVSLAGILLFGYIDYALYTSANLVPTFICAIPTLLFVFFGLSAIFRPRNREQESMISEYVRAIFIRALPENPKEDDHSSEPRP